LIGDDDALDHVADDRRPWATFQLDGYDSAIPGAAQRTIDPCDPRRATEARSNETPTPNLATNRAGGMGEVDGAVAGGHVISVAQGCDTPSLVSTEWTNPLF
jgi:hypothetical protein